MLLQHPFISSFHKSAHDGRVPKQTGCFLFQHGIYTFCSELRTKAGKSFTNLFHFESVAQQIKEKGGFNILQVRRTFSSADQRDISFQYNIPGVTTATFQKSNNLGRKLNRVRVGKNIINVILSDRHSRVSPSKQKISFSRFKQYDQGNNFATFQNSHIILQTHILTVRYDKGLVSQLHAAYVGKI